MQVQEIFRTPCLSSPQALFKGYIRPLVFFESKKSIGAVSAEHGACLAIVLGRIYTLAALQCDGCTFRKGSETLSQAWNHAFTKNEHTRKHNRKKTTAYYTHSRPYVGGKSFTLQLFHGIPFRRCLLFQYTPTISRWFLIVVTILLF